MNNQKHANVILIIYSYRKKAKYLKRDTKETKVKMKTTMTMSIMIKKRRKARSLKRNSTKTKVNMIYNLNRK